MISFFTKSKVMEKERILCGTKSALSRGFTLLELVLVIAIFSLGSYAISVLIIDAQNTTYGATSRTAALLYAREGLEVMRSMRDSGGLASLDACVTCGVAQVASTTGTAWAFSGSSNTSDDGVYTRQLSVTATSPSYSYARLVTSVVTWSILNSRAETISLSTWMTSWR